MRIPRVFDKRRRRYEELVTQHLDGVLDAAGEARLQEVLDGDPALAVEVRELEAVTALVRAEPLVEPPRSFALPYAPARVPAPPRSGALPWMQAATATAALLLVTLIGVDLVAAPTGGPVGVSGAPEIGASAPSAAPSEDAPVAFEAVPAPDAPAIDSAVGGDGIERDVIELPAPARTLTREPEPLPAPVAQPARSPLDWAQLGVGMFTALLAMGVALVSWRAGRRRA